MSTSNGLTEIDGIFDSVSDLEKYSGKTETTVSVNDGGSIQWYKIKTVDDGSAVALDNGLFANPVDDVDPQTATNTANIATNTAAINKLKGLSPNNQTGTSYTLVLTDADAGEVWMNNAAANVLTIPTNAAVAFPIETVILVQMEGVGVTSITAAAGVTLNGVVAGSGDLTQYNGVALKKRATDTWVATPLTVA